MKRGRLFVILALVLLGAVVLFLLPGGESAEFDVVEEFATHPLIHLPSIGPVDLSVNKTVVYLWITFGVVCVLAFFINRGVKPVPGRFQFAMETLYELARDGIVGSRDEERPRHVVPLRRGGVLLRPHQSTWSASSRCRSPSTGRSASTRPRRTST